VHRIWKNISLVGVFALGSAGVSAQASTTVARGRIASAAAVRVGVLAPLSGPSAVAGGDIVNAVKLAVANLNRARGVLGRPIVLDVQDSPCAPQAAAQSAQKLVADGVAAVVGPYCSSDAFAASAIFHRAGIAMVTPASTNPRLTQQGLNNIFRTIGRDDQQGVFAAGLMVHTFHATRIAIIHDNGVYAKGLATATRDALSRYHGARVVFFDALTPGERDFSAILTNLRGVRPQVTYFTGYYADGGLLLKEFKQLGVSGQFMAGSANDDVTFIKLAGPSAGDAYVTTAPPPQMIPSAATFVRQFTTTYHRAPGPYAGYAYDAANVVVRAIAVARSTDPPAIVRALHATKDYPGITGPIAFTATGDRAQFHYVVVTPRNGHFVPARL